MNPAPASSRPNRRLGWWIAAGLLVVLSPFVAVGVAAWSVLTLDRNAGALHREFAAADRALHPQVQVSVGRLTLGAARTLLHFIDRPHVDEARLALAAVHHASVGVYQRGNRAAAPDLAGLLARTDPVMARRGLARLVSVRDDQSQVVIYASSEPNRSGRLELCLAVLEERELVVASTEIEAEALAELVRHSAEAHGLGRRLRAASL